MLWIQLLFGSVFIIALLATFYIYYYNLFQLSIVRINEVEGDIDNLLRNKFELLNRAISIIKASADIKEEVMEDIVKLRSRKLSSFEFDQKLGDALNEFYKIREIYPEVKESDAFLKINNSLEDIEEQIIACRSYYNDNITKYNKLVKTIPSNLIAKTLQFKEKTFYDGKDMYDSIYNDFKL